MIFRHAPEARRLSVTVQGRRVHGLPALCVALCRRSSIAWLLALFVLPLAVTVESLREILLVYDEECPLCDAYCRMVRIRESVGVPPAGDR